MSGRAKHLRRYGLMETKMFFEQCLDAGIDGEVYTWSEGEVLVDAALALKAATRLGYKVVVTLTNGNTMTGIITLRPQGNPSEYVIFTDLNGTSVAVNQSNLVSIS